MSAINSSVIAYCHSGDLSACVTHVGSTESGRGYLVTKFTFSGLKMPLFDLVVTGWREVLGVWGIWAGGCWRSEGIEDKGEGEMASWLAEDEEVFWCGGGIDIFEWGCWILVGEGRVLLGKGWMVVRGGPYAWGGMLGVGRTTDSWGKDGIWLFENG